MEYLNGSGNSSCCDTSCCYKFDVEGCAAGVPYIQLTLVAVGGVTTIKWMNLNSGDLVDVKPVGFATGTCSEVGDNQKTCYTFGADSYTVYKTNGVTTYVKNGTVLTAQVDIDAAVAVLATATYENIADCTPITPAVTCKGAHYVQLTLAAGVAQTITHDFAMTDPLAIGYSVRGVDGSTVGDWPTGVRFINQTATTVDVIADGISGVVDVALFNTECLAEVVTSGTASGGSGGGSGTDSQTLSTSGVNLTISNGNTVSLASAITAGETTTTLTSVLSTGTKLGSYTNEDGTVTDLYAPASGGGSNSGISGAGGQSLSVNTVGMATQNIVTGALYPGTDITMSNTVQNTFANGSTWDGTTFTAGEAAVYFVSFEIRYGSTFAVAATKVYQSFLLFNGTNVSSNLEAVEVSATINTLQVSQKTYMVSMQVGDTLKLQGATNDTATGTKPVYASRGTSLNIARLSGA